MMELEDWVVDSTNQVDALREALRGVAHVTGNLKADLAGWKKSDCRAELSRFCDNLMGLGLGVQQHQG